MRRPATTGLLGRLRALLFVLWGIPSSEDSPPRELIER
jgi:hypothetical protein